MKQDWRLSEATEHLKEITLKKMLYGQRVSTASHDHCEFCMTLFYDGPISKTALLQGYTTLDEYYWVCERCYQDFHEMFKWTLDKELSVDTLCIVNDSVEKGYWFNQETKEVLHPDFGPPTGIRPHYDWKSPKTNRWMHWYSENELIEKSEDT